MKTVKLLMGTSLALLLVLQACNSTKSQDTSKATQKTAEEPIEIIGKSATLVFPQFKVIETFLSDSTLHWQFFPNNGNVTESDEHISYKKINDHQFFINWIEKTGLTVSQILDAKNGTAVSYVSRSDEKSERGKRSASLIEGTFKLNEEGKK